MRARSFIQICGISLVLQAHDRTQDPGLDRYVISPKLLGRRPANLYMGRPDLELGTIRVGIVPPFWV